MLKVDQENDKLFVITLDGKITGEDMERELDRLIDDSAGLSEGRLLYDIRGFEWPTLDAIGVKLTKLPQLFSLLGRFDRAAVMTDKNWISQAAKLENWLIPGLEIKTFALEEEPQAREWLNG